jgi:hypothetical protein
LSGRSTNQMIRNLSEGTTAHWLVKLGLDSMTAADQLLQEGNVDEAMNALSVIKRMNWFCSRGENQDPALSFSLSRPFPEKSEWRGYDNGKSLIFRLILGENPSYKVTSG